MISRDDGRSRDPLVRSGAFQLGQLVMTSGVQASIPPSEVLHAVRRHAQCDWGDLGSEDRSTNDRALKEGERLYSAYHAKDGTKFLVITEWDRSLTTVLLPSEY